MRQTSREELFNDIAPFLDAGLLKLVYEVNRVCVFNASNYGYIAAPAMKTSTGLQIGLSFNSLGLKKIVKDPTYIHKKLLYGSQEYMKQCLVIFNDYTFQKLTDLKKETDKYGPGPGVDLSLERALRRK